MNQKILFGAKRQFITKRKPPTRTSKKASLTYQYNV